MSLPYIKLEYSESIDTRKNILNSEVNLLNLLSKLNKYKKLRRNELVKKTKLKTILRQVKIKLGSLNRDMPKIEMLELEQPIREMAFEAKERGKIESELEEIKKRLEEL